MSSSDVATFTERLQAAREHFAEIRDGRSPRYPPPHPKAPPDQQRGDPASASASYDHRIDRTPSPPPVTSTTVPTAAGVTARSWADK